MDRVKKSERLAVLNAFTKDKQSLFMSFRLTSSLRFHDFASCWRDMKFSLVLCGKSSKELKAFLEDAYELCLEDIRPEKDVDRKVFALYMMYSLFMKQPCDTKTSIRLSIQGWQDVKDLLFFAQENQHLDIIYIWKRLRDEKAVDFVYSVRYFGPTTKKYSKESSREVSDAADKLKAALDDQLADLASFHSHYESCKSIVSTKELKDICPEVSDPFSVLRDDLEFIDQNQGSSLEANWSLAADSLSVIHQATTEQGERHEESIGEKRQRLKNRSRPQPSSKYSK